MAYKKIAERYAPDGVPMYDYLCDTEADLAAIGVCCSGSSAYVVETGKTYVHSCCNEWEEKPESGGGGGGGGSGGDGSTKVYVSEDVTTDAGLYPFLVECYESGIMPIVKTSYTLEGITFDLYCPMQVKLPADLLGGTGLYFNGVVTAYVDAAMSLYITCIEGGAVIGIVQ